MKRTRRAGQKVEDVIQTFRAHLPELRKRYGVKSLGVFGSYVKGEQGSRSDLDVLVEFLDDAKPDLLEFAKLQQELSDVLGVKVDLVEKKGLKPYIGKRILEEVIYLSETGGSLVREPPSKGGNVAGNRKREIRDYLKDILDNVDNVERFTAGIDFEAFASDREKVYAVLHALLIVGEAARKIPTSLKRRHPEVPWRSIVGLRNIVAHEYFAVNLPRVWRIVREDLIRLKEAVVRIWQDLAAGN